MTNSKRILLDKNVVRKLLRGLAKVAQNIVPAVEEQNALDLLSLDSLASRRLFIVPATDNILSLYYSDLREVHTLRRYSEVIIPMGYWRRWARRLQARGFTREDARVLSLAVFGTDAKENFLGVDELLTIDKTLVTLFDEKRVPIQKQLDAFKHEVKTPYDAAKLPTVVLLGQPLENKP